jgi:hypothetical protein
MYSNLKCLPHTKDVEKRAVSTSTYKQIQCDVCCDLNSNSNTFEFKLNKRDVTKIKKFATTCIVYIVSHSQLVEYVGVTRLDLLWIQRFDDLFDTIRNSYSILSDTMTRDVEAIYGNRKSFPTIHTSEPFCIIYSIEPGTVLKSNVQMLNGQHADYYRMVCV